MRCQPFETILHDAGLALAIEPLRQWFESERLDNPRLQTEIAREVIERTAEALTVFTRPRMVH